MHVARSHTRRLQTFANGRGYIGFGVGTPIYLTDRAVLLKLDMRPMLPFYDVPGVTVRNTSLFRHSADRHAFLALPPHVQNLFVG